MRGSVHFSKNGRQRLRGDKTVFGLGPLVFAVAISSGPGETNSLRWEENQRPKAKDPRPKTKDLRPEFVETSRHPLWNRDRCRWWRDCLPRIFS